MKPRRSDRNGRQWKPLQFIELPGFEDDWRSLRLHDDDLMQVQRTLMRDPTASPVIPGTGGLRKMRFAPARSRFGKRGGIRICYAHFPRPQIVVLVMAFSKTRKGDLTPEQKKTIKRILKRYEEEFALPPYSKGPQQ